MTLVLADEAGTVLGALPDFPVPDPWWQEVSEVVAAARERYGLEATVLRLISAGQAAPPGGHVTYLAQVRTPVPVELAPCPVDPGWSPVRMPWAVPGGPAESVRWALGCLPAGAVAVQMRSWNLSAVWRCDVGGEPVAWLKQVPGFLAPEPAVLRLVGEVAPGLVPAVLATGAAGRALLAHVPGADRYGAGPGFCAAVARDFHAVQEHFATRQRELIDAGVPDRRLDHDRLARVAGAYADRIPGLAALLADLPARLAALAACGLPDTLVHGDLHPGNVRETPDGARVILDWGDATVGHPAFDILRLTDDPAVLGEWAARWRTAVPGCDPLAAADLARPLAELRAAAAYQDFVDHIEESERPYHALDIPDRLAAAGSIVGG
ncbi:aminoglycoside phosphotransferase [Actinoplanes sp. N902-109]|nr:aminoglycoside phosphotransferase [Actinoplanes sp. N902-109]